MDRKEQLKFCKICKKQKFDIKQGIICGLTDLPANFEESCDAFSEDSELKKKNELQVERYDAAEVEAKKKKILKRIAIGIGVAALLGYFGLCRTTPSTKTTIEPMIQFMTGGNGAWFNSVIVFLGE